MSDLQVESLSFIGRRGYVADFFWGDKDYMPNTAHTYVPRGVAIERSWIFS